MAGDVVDPSSVGGYAAAYDRERAGYLSSSANLVKRHVRWDEAWSGRVGFQGSTEDGFEFRGDRHLPGRSTGGSRRTRATSPETLQRGWVRPMARVPPAPPAADVKLRASSQPRSSGRSSNDVFSRRDPSCAGTHRNDDDTNAPTPRSRFVIAPTAHKRPGVTHRDFRDANETSTSNANGANVWATHSQITKKKNQARRGLSKPLSKVLKETPTCYDATKRRISVVEGMVTEVDLLPDCLPIQSLDVERFYASRNALTSLTNFKQFPKLRLLGAGDNDIDDISEIDTLAKGCPLMEVLSLERTPVSTLPFYRQHVIARFPRLKTLDGETVTPSERDRASRAVRMDVALLENLMRAAATANKLKRAYELSRVHEELRAVVFTARGPVSPQSLPGRDDQSAPLVSISQLPNSASAIAHTRLTLSFLSYQDARRWLKLCAPEKAMTSREVSLFAKRLRIAVANEAPEIKRRWVESRAYANGNGSRDNGRANLTTMDAAQLWEGSYSLRQKREQNDAAALLVYLEDRSLAFSEAAQRKQQSDPFATALRYGFEAAAAREAETRNDRERALGDIIDAEAALAFRVTTEMEIGEEGPGFESDEGEEETRHESRRTSGRVDNGHMQVEQARQKPRDERHEHENERPAANDHDSAAWEEWYRSERRLSSDAGSGSGRRNVGFVGTEGHGSKRGTLGTSASSEATQTRKVPWGHGPGTKSEGDRARLATEARAGDGNARAGVMRVARAYVTAANRRTRSESPTRARPSYQPNETRLHPATPRHSPPRKRPATTQNPELDRRSEWEYDRSDERYDRRDERYDEPYNDEDDDDESFSKSSYTKSSSRAPRDSSRPSSRQNSRSRSTNPNPAGSGPVDPSQFAEGGVYELLSAEVDALRDALLRQTTGEREVLRANAVLLKRCEEAELSCERFRKENNQEAAQHAELLRDARAETEACKAHAAELASALDATAESADSADARDLKSRVAAETAIADLNSLRAALESAQADAESLREALAGKIRDEERAANADSLALRSAGRRALRAWLQKTKRNQQLRVLRSIHAHRRVADLFETWRSRGTNQVKLRLLRSRIAAKGAVAALRAWRLHGLVSCVNRCLTTRRVLKRWRRETTRRENVRGVFAHQGVYQANAVADAGDAFAPLTSPPSSVTESETDVSPQEGVRTETRRHTNDRTTGSTYNVYENTRNAGAETLSSTPENEQHRADVLHAWREETSFSNANRDKKTALDAYANAVLLAARPFTNRLRHRMFLSRAMSQWHLVVTRAQQVRLETLVTTCDALGGAAEKAAEEAVGLEGENRKLQELLARERVAANPKTVLGSLAGKVKDSEELSEHSSEGTSAQPSERGSLQPSERGTRGSTQPSSQPPGTQPSRQPKDEEQQSELLAVEESNFSKEKARFTKALETERAARRLAEDEVTIMKRRVAGESGETKRAEAVAAAAAGEAAAWRSAAVSNENAVRTAVGAFVEWSSVLESERATFQRDVGETTVKKAKALRGRISAFSFDTPQSTRGGNQSNTPSSTQSSGRSEGSSTSAGSNPSGGDSSQTPTSRQTLINALRVLGLDLGDKKETDGSDSKPFDSQFSISALPAPARSAASFLQTHVKLANALRLCGEEESKRRETIEANHAGAAQAAQAARARVLANTSAATNAVALSFQAEAAATILQSAVRGHLVRKKQKKASKAHRSRRKDDLRVDDALEEPVRSDASGENIFSEKAAQVSRGSPQRSQTLGAQRSSPGAVDSVHETETGHRRPSYDEQTQTPPGVDNAETQTPPRKAKLAASLSPSASTPTTAGSGVSRNPFSSAKRVLREGKVVVTPTPTKSIKGPPPSKTTNPPWKPPSGSLFASPLSPPMSPRNER